MFLSSINLVNYKNYSNQTLHFDGSTVAVVGLNGMGKTNLLDAIYYSCIGKSYFTSSDRNIVRKGEDFFRVVGQMSGGVESKITIKVQPGKLKSIEIDGKKHEKISDHVGKYPVVIIAPVDIQLLMEGSEPRRSFINNSIVQFSKEYLNALLKYNRLLKQRNALLKRFGEARYFDGNLLESINVAMSDPAQTIFRFREDFVAQISPLFNKMYERISGGHEECGIIYQSQLQKESLSDLFDQNLEKDRILCRSTQGVHKDDLKFIMNGDKLKVYASQGQLKSYVLALKLAQYQWLRSQINIDPILLLDDLFDKLDTNRVSFLLDLITGEDFGHVLISDTNVDRIPTLLDMKKIKHQRILVNEGIAKYEEEE